MGLIDNLTQIMEKKNISAYQLEKAGIVKQTTFTSWKKGTQPALDKIINIMQYIEVTPNELFGYPTEKLLTENEQELLEQFRKLSDRDQIKFIGRIEEYIKNAHVSHKLPHQGPYFFPLCRQKFFRISMCL